MSKAFRWGLLLVFCLVNTLVCAQTPEETVAKLVEAGFENVRQADGDEGLVFSLENNLYKVQSQGIAKALEIIQSSLKGNEPCMVVFTQYNVPQVSLTYRPNTTVDENVKVALTDWTASYDVEKAWNQVKKEKKQNSSLFKVDVLVYPQLSFKNLILNQVYQWMFHFSPSVEVSLWPGGKLAAMLKVPVYNDGFGSLEDKFHPGQITLSQRFALAYGIKGRVTAGYFNSSRWGLDAQLMMPFKDRRWSAEARAGYLGKGYWRGMHLHYDTEMQLHWSAGVNFFWPRYNTQFKLTANKWLLNDQGVKFEMIRHFRFASIGFYAFKATDNAAHVNGGFRFQVALPPYKYKRKGYIPRISTSNQMGLVYNAGNEQYYYREYKTEASDNIMEANGFNPLFIENEMSNF